MPPHESATGAKVSKSSTKWILESRPHEPRREEQLINQMQDLSISQLNSLWRAVVTELKARYLTAEAALL